MKAIEIMEVLKEKSLPLIEAYHNDLLEIDKNWLEENEGVPFLHVTKSNGCGTYLDALIPYDQYPKVGQMVPYLFGKADRMSMLEQIGTSVRHAKRELPSSKVLYFNGTEIKEVTFEEALEVIFNYQRDMKEKFTG